jgi:protoporphyrinogen oxidase
MTPSCRVAILGAGPAGVGAAYRLIRLTRGAVTVLERGSSVGGLASSFQLAGMHVDYGSHRLHPACHARILADIRALLGEDLLDRPRHGRIRLRGRWIHFPLKPVDLAFSLPPAFALGATADLVKKAWPFSKNGDHAPSFASILKHGLGATICRDFYFPYARKIWGVDAEKLSAIQAQRRVKAGSLGKVLRKILSAVPGLKPPGSGRFYYPRRGFGQITQAYFEAASVRGAAFQFGAAVDSVNTNSDGEVEVEYHCGDQVRKLSARHVWSTIPLPVLVRSIRPQAPPEVLEAAERIRYRSMILIYLVLGQQRFSEFDAHYFPESDVPITRLSEPRNYSAVTEPPDRTVLCAELPCAQGDHFWALSDEQLGELVAASLVRLGLPFGPVVQVTTRRLPQAYPIYELGYEEHFQRLDGWLEHIPGLVSLGRQGLFAHDNTHHTLAMAYAAADCLDDRGDFNRDRWREYRKTFEAHVVED